MDSTDTLPPAMPPKPADSQQLAPKEAGLFRGILRNYELKLYKKVLKSADAILKKYPDNGETLAMKGLTYNAMSTTKKELKAEAYELLKKGLSLNIRSSVCWHAFGLYHRADGNYPEAVKCYRNALRIDEGNQQILRDLAHLQVQIRDITGMQETRRELLQLRSNVAPNWIGFAVSYYLSKNYDMAFQILASYTNTLPKDDAAPTYNSNELTLFAAQILEEKGDFAAAARHLAEGMSKVVDRRQFDEKLAELYLRLGRYEEAQAILEILMDINPDHYGTHRNLQFAHLRTFVPGLTRLQLPSSAIELTGDQMATLDALYGELQAAEPRCRTHFRVTLDYQPASHPQFRGTLDRYLKHGLRKGIPSLFSDLKPLYADSAKAVIMQELVESYLVAGRAGARLPVLDASMAEDNGRSDPPSTLLWVLLFAAKHFDRVGNRDQALVLLDEAIAHSPAAVDVYVFKARVLKRLGRFLEAAEVMDFGRRLDFADRYVNTKTTKYLLRVNKYEQASGTMALFAREGEHPEKNIFEMQHMVFELQRAKAYVRVQAFGKALKQFLNVKKHFEVFEADQFDFHAYCLRKHTLRVYTRTLAMIDELPGHACYLDALKGIVKVYLTLVDDPALVTAARGGDPSADDLSKMSAADRKKAKSKMRKKAKKASDKKAAAAGAGGASGAGAWEDEDPEGVKLVTVEDPLAEAHTFAQKLLVRGEKDIGALALVFDVALRRGRLLQAVRAYNKAKALDAASPDVLRMGLLAVHAATNSPAGDAPPAVVLREFADGVLAAHGGSFDAFAESVKASCAASYPQRLAVADALVRVLPSSAAAAEALLDPTAATSGVTLETCAEASRLLRAWGNDTAQAAHLARCATLFPKSDAFDEQVVETSNPPGLLSFLPVTTAAAAEE